MTRAYSKLYLESAQDILGQAFDWVTNTCNEDISLFCISFAKSRIASMFESGYPKYAYPHEFYAHKSPEYWSGWAIAYFQWKSRIPFIRIFHKIPIEKVIALYPIGHEQDIRSVADIFTDWLMVKTFFFDCYRNMENLTAMVVHDCSDITFVLPDGGENSTQVGEGPLPSHPCIILLNDLY